MEKSNNKIVSVPFLGNNLLLVEHKDEPYVAMKPIVGGIGLDWSYQFRKLSQNTERWGVAVIAIPSQSGYQKTLCLPLRKLAGWLMTIQPSRLKPAIREKALAFQNECDDVLWNYWTRGAAINPRVSEDRIAEVVQSALDRYESSRKGDPQIEREKMRLELARFQTDKAMKLKEMAFDLQTRALFDVRYVRRLVEHSVSLLTGEVLSPKVSVDLSEFLRTRGIALSGGSAAAFGKLVAQVHRERRGREPGKRPIILNGREVMANYYQEPDDTPILEEALLHFRRTHAPRLIPLFGREWQNPSFRGAL